MALLTIKTDEGDYVEADDRQSGFFLAAHSCVDDPVGYAKLSRRQARTLRDKLTRWLDKATK
jgi:hypothetical protein